MIKQNKQLIIKITLIGLIMLVAVLSSLLVVTLNKLKANKDWSGDIIIHGDIEDYYVITYQYGEMEKELFLLKTEKSTDILTFLLYFELFDMTDFDSYDGTNYYFKDSLTDVLELKDNDQYYESSEWGPFLIVGLQSIIINQNLTIVRTNY